MGTLTDNQIINWKNDFTGADTNSPQAGDSMASNLDQQLREIKSVSRAESINKQWERWLNVYTGLTFSSGTAFTVTGDFITANPTFQVGRRIKATVTAGTVYGYVASASFNGSITTVNVTLDSGALDAGLSEVQVGAVSTTTGSSIPQTIFRQNFNPNYVSISNVGAAWTGTLAPAITAYAQGVIYMLKWGAASQGSDTVNLNGLGALTCKKYGTATNLAANDIPAGSITPAVYDGTNLQILTLGAAGGDLSGTFPSPTVAKLQGNAVKSGVPGANTFLGWVSANSDWEAVALPASSEGQNVSQTTTPGTSIASGTNAVLLTLASAAPAGTGNFRAIVSFGVAYQSHTGGSFSELEVTLTDDHAILTGLPVASGSNSSATQSETVGGVLISSGVVAGGTTVTFTMKGYASGAQADITQVASLSANKYNYIQVAWIPA